MVWTEIGVAALLASSGRAFAPSLEVSSWISLISSVPRMTASGCAFADVTNLSFPLRFSLATLDPLCSPTPLASGVELRSATGLFPGLGVSESNVNRAKRFELMDPYSPSR